MIDLPELDNLLELIKRASTCLPADVVAALQAAAAGAVAGSSERATLELMLENTRLAAARRVPLCQDTGCLTFYVDHPPDWPVRRWRERIAAAVAAATAQALLRPNSVDSLTSANPGDNLGAGFPQVYATEWEQDSVRIRLLLKGGGSENVSTQYALPDTALGAGRDLAGVRRVLLHAVHAAQGQGCAPGILGVCIGGDRGQGYIEAKKQLLRPLTDQNAVPELAALEEQVVQEANTLGIGPLGLGGATTLLGVKIGTLHRHPASFFVTIAYMCWECRRATMLCRPGREVEYNA